LIEYAPEIQKILISDLSFTADVDYSIGTKTPPTGKGHRRLAKSPGKPPTSLHLK
jgi:hypothetical protein